MVIIIENMQEAVPVNDGTNRLIEKSVELCLESENFTTPSEIGILLVDNEYIREINRTHRGIDKPTDVLSFPMVTIVDGNITSSRGDFDLDGNVLLLGDIVLSMEKAVEQAGEYGHSMERELAFLTTHGVFHLLGYDHMTQEDETTMMEKQEAVLERMGLAR